MAAGFQGDGFQEDGFELDPIVSPALLVQPVVVFDPGFSLGAITASPGLLVQAVTVFTPTPTLGLFVVSPGVILVDVVMFAPFAYLEALPKPIPIKAMPLRKLVVTRVADGV